jgi:hypothetical protein
MDDQKSHYPRPKARQFPGEELWLLHALKLRGAGGVKNQKPCQAGLPMRLKKPARGRTNERQSSRRNVEAEQKDICQSYERFGGV